MDNFLSQALLESTGAELAFSNELFLSLGVKDLAQEGSHHANDPK
jgi:hypothetical protein